MPKVTTLKWYKFFNNKTEQKHNVLIKDQTFYPENIIIAKKLKNIWLYAKFVSIKQFIDYFLLTPIQNQTFYTILTHSTRYLYLDIDYKLTCKLSIKHHDILINQIMNCLQKFTKTYGYKFGIKYRQSKWWIWNASRFDDKKNYYYEKFSLHIIDAGNIMYYLDIKNFAYTFNYWLNKNHMINQKCKIDINIYHNEYQAWRLPYNHNGNIASLLKLYKNNIDLYSQMQVNIMNDIKFLSKLYISKNHNQLHLQFTIKYSLNSKKKMNQKEQNMIKQNKVLIQNIPSIYIYKNIHTINIQTMQLIQQIFKINTFDTFKNNEFIIHRHYCPILKAIHNINSGRLCILNIQNHINSDYCIYTCMDSECQNKMKQLYISLS